jgi:hypothetical protein
MHLPTWRFQPPALPGRVISATDGLALLERLRDRARAPDAAEPGDDAPELYFVRAVRCWLGPAADRPSAEAPICRALHTHPDIEPVFVDEVANLGETATFSRYGHAARLTVGLYRRAADARRTPPRARSRRSR